MKKISLAEFKELLKKLPVIIQKQILEGQLEIVRDESIRNELLRIMASLPPTEAKKIKHAEIADESWKKIGSLIENIQIAPKEDDSLERAALQARPQPTLEDVVAQESPKKEEADLGVKYERAKDVYERGQEYKPFKQEQEKPPGSPQHFERTFRSGSEEARESTKSARKRELEETEKYKR